MRPPRVTYRTSTVNCRARQQLRNCPFWILGGFDYPSRYFMVLLILLRKQVTSVLKQSKKQKNISCRNWRVVISNHYLFISEFRQTTAGWYVKLGHDLFIPHSFHVIIQWSSYYSTQYSPSNWKFRSISQEQNCQTSELSFFFVYLTCHIWVVSIYKEKVLIHKLLHQIFGVK